MAAETGGTSSLSLCDKLGLTDRWRQRPQCTYKHFGLVPYHWLCHLASRIASLGCRSLYAWVAHRELLASCWPSLPTIACTYVVRSWPLLTSPRRKPAAVLHACGLWPS